MSQSSSPGRLGARFAALLIDSLLGAGALAAALGVAELLGIRSTGLDLVLFELGFVLVPYVAVPLAMGDSLGYRCLGLHLVGPDGAPVVSPLRLAWRAVVKVHVTLGFLPLCALASLAAGQGEVFAFTVTRSSRGLTFLHDLAALTWVVGGAGNVPRSDAASDPCGGKGRRSAVLR
jgi:uncharacterized RDD family membrane protein YckC